MAKKNTYPRTMAMITQFRNELIAEMKKNLQPSNASGRLSDSIKGTPITIANDKVSFSVEMEDYADFVDKGVKGSNPSAMKNGVQKAPNSPYSYKDKMPPPKALDSWTIRRGVAPRDEKGRFLPRKSMRFAIARSIFYQGLRPTFFLTKAYKKYLTPQFELDLMLAYSRDIEENLRQ